MSDPGLGVVFSDDAADSSPDPDGVKVRVPAKINLALCVGGLRDDGYHELATVFQAVSLYDDIVATPAHKGISCEVHGPEAHKIGPGNKNLAYQAAQLLAEYYWVSDGAHLRIDKRIPVAGGMAGGSADTAGALLACARLWELPVTMEELRELGSQLGADVPFALMGGCAMGLGKGEQLTPVLSRGVYHWVLAFSHREVSTAESYSRFDRTATATAGRAPELPRELMMALASGDVPRVGRSLVNDLQPIAYSLVPELKQTVRAGQGAGCLGNIVSGSGPTVAFLVENESAATDLAVALSSQGVARQVQPVTGPVPGAMIIQN
ncbi:MAG: 4-(cytidine 5'-diphospho)-2-C-methyl-D-erythritol kinase [Propionibacteriaceae bacterium]|nr:4-(cytidine 5'-diphospho)-2-C-methyl-D-erythritol kinase [Propionibacteriaceae bacterium]